MTVLKRTRLTDCRVAIFQINMFLQVYKVRPNDPDAKKKFTECNKIVQRIQFERAIAVEKTERSIVDSINLDSMSI